MKSAGIVIGLVALIALAVVGVLLRVSLRDYADSRADLVRADLNPVRDALARIENRLAAIETQGGPKLLDVNLEPVNKRLDEFGARLDKIEKNAAAAASSAAPSEERGNLRGSLDSALGLLGKDEVNMTEEQKKELEEKRSEAFRGLMRQGTKEFAKIARKQQEKRLQNAVEKLNLDAGQEDRLRTIIDEAFKKFQELADKQINGEEVSPEDWRKFRDETDAQVKEALTEDQYQEWQKSDPWRGPGGPGGFGRPRRQQEGQQGGQGEGGPGGFR